MGQHNLLEFYRDFIYMLCHAFMKNLRPYSPILDLMETGHVLLTVLHHLHFLIGPAPLDDTAESIALEKGNGCHIAMGLKWRSGFVFEGIQEHRLPRPEEAGTAGKVLGWQLTQSCVGLSIMG